MRVATFTTVVLIACTAHADQLDFDLVHAVTGKRLTSIACDTKFEGRFVWHDTKLTSTTGVLYADGKRIGALPIAIFQGPSGEMSYPSKSSRARFFKLISRVPAGTKDLTFSFDRGKTLTNIGVTCAKGGAPYAAAARGALTFPKPRPALKGWRRKALRLAKKHRWPKGARVVRMSIVADKWRIHYTTTPRNKRIPTDREFAAVLGLKKKKACTRVRVTFTQRFLRQRRRYTSLTLGGVFKPKPFPCDKL